MTTAQTKTSKNLENKNKSSTKSSSPRKSSSMGTSVPGYLQAKLSNNQTADVLRVEEGEADTLNKERVQRTALQEEEQKIQTKLEVGSPDDIQEKQADQVAEKVMRQVSAKDEIEEEQFEASETIGIQAKSDGAAVPKVSHKTQKSIANPGGGTPLGTNVRSKVEPVLDADLSHVRVHSDKTAQEAASSINARAFTHGSNIWLGSGESTSDIQLIAHESTHVVQQGAANAMPSSLQAKKIQRDDNDDSKSRPVPTEFIPQFSAEPSGTKTLRIFEHHIHSWNIGNWQNAPDGTYFHWGWGAGQDGILTAIADDTENAGSTRHIWLQARRPGETRIQGTPVYQVPGGPQLTGMTRYANVTVAQPTLRLFSYMPRKPDGSGTDSDHLSPGDRLIVRVRVGNVDGSQMENPSLVSIYGPGHELVSIGTTTPVQDFEDGRSYDIELIARTPGSLNFQLEPRIGDSVVGRGPSVDVTGEIEFDRQQFINLTNQCDTIIARAYTRVNSVMEVLSAAYGNAYDDHVATLRAQDASNRLAGDILLGAALAFIPGGVGGVVGGMMKRAEVGEFLADAIKDMAKAGVKGMQGALLPGGGGPMRPMGNNPRTWRAQYAVRVNNEKERVLDILNEWKTKANRSDPDFYMNFDPVIRTEQSLIANGQAIKDIAIPDQAEHERLFELGMWREWLTNHGYTVGRSSGGYMSGPSYYAQENQGKKIRDRINALREDGEHWLEYYGGIARRKAESEARRRNREARGFGANLATSINKGIASGLEEL